MKSTTAIWRALALCVCFASTAGCDDAVDSPPADDATGGTDTSGTDTSGTDHDDDTPSSPPSSLVSEARARLEAAGGVVSIGRSLLETLGVLPDYECSDTALDLSASVAARLDSVFSCADVGAHDDGFTTRVVFPAAGCRALGMTFGGELSARASAGLGRLTVALDLYDLTVNGEAVNAAGYYDKCGDVGTLGVESSGSLDSGAAYWIDLAITREPGLPIVGASTLRFTGVGDLTDEDGTDRISLFDLEYEPGALLPKSGTLVVETANGHRVEAVFTERSPLHGEVEIRIDDFRPITLPLL